ncbi:MULTISPECIES: hypothetical protein [unclassified Variovorax]|uniref:hypothetical protein n=1 Tax=unclassified Variovorax TaxID=663243 RepID=UPI003F47BF0D
MDEPKVRRALKTPAPQPKTPSRRAVLRAVASSTALETGQCVFELELRLQRATTRFPHIKLAQEKR